MQACILASTFLAGAHRGHRNRGSSGVKVLASPTRSRYAGRGYRWWTEDRRKPRMSSTLLDHGSSVGGTAGAHDEGERPKVRGPPLAQFWRGPQVPTVPRSEGPAVPASSRAPSPFFQKKLLGEWLFFCPSMGMLMDGCACRRESEHVYTYRQMPCHVCTHACRHSPRHMHRHVHGHLRKGQWGPALPLSWSTQAQPHAWPGAE